MMREFGT
jgi:hypothetical protein